MYDDFDAFLLALLHPVRLTSAYELLVLAERRRISCGVLFPRLQELSELGLVAIVATDKGFCFRRER